MSYIETAARYDKITEDGTVKKVTERFIVEALSCPEAEARVIEEISPFVSGDLEVTANKKVAVAEVINAADANRLYLAKVTFVAIDERTAKEKRTTCQWLIGGTDFNDAYEMLLRQLNGIMADTEIVSLGETAYRDFYPAKL